MTTDPIQRFSEWLKDASHTPGIAEANAMSLATADAKGRPSVRMVLLKDFSKDGFVFYTNLESRKAAELKANPYAALGFYWEPLGRQVRIEGKVSPTTAEQADEYFATRPRLSQIGAWASQQSRPLANRALLIDSVEAITRKYENQQIPRPPHWSGWVVAPEVIEFWQMGEFRLHDREVFRRSGESWAMEKLYP